jgi:fatty-acyl-CoA synthase
MSLVTDRPTTAGDATAADATAARMPGSGDWLRALEAVAPIAAKPRRTLPVVIGEMAKLRGDAVALISHQETFSYRELAARMNRYARWAIAQGLGKPDTVCLMMPNRPEYLAIWLGISSTGAVVALLNPELRGAALKHCVDIVSPRHLIVAGALAGRVRDAGLADSITLWTHGEAGTGSLGQSLDRAVERYAPEPLEGGDVRPITIDDRALTIYTSGTTGLPKAANVSHRRLLQWSYWFAGLMDVGAGDRIYDCLPMHHSVGGVVATGALLVRGGSVAIRDGFSVSAFWDDICGFDCTLFQYIGELCRYLVNAPPHPKERSHRLRLCAGNGLRPDIWERFAARFDIPRILEFYAATEANVSLYNVEGKVGALGKVPPFLAHRFPLALVQFDPKTERPARDANGRCVRVANGETGEAIGRIGDGGAAGGSAFEGYSSAAATEEKILRDVFAPGDAWYRTGDLMRRDDAGYYYFVDRIGDTFRWKGENVSTSEVAGVLASFPGVLEATAYGVHIPGHEGAAGTAALVTAAPLDLSALRRHLDRHLPAYARPLFLRLRDRLDVTATFKPKKAELARDGFDPARSRDPLFVSLPGSDAYVPLDAALYGQLIAGTVRL